MKNFVMTALMLGACAGDGGGTVDGTNPDFDGPPTNTIPSFTGRAPKNVIMISVDTFRRDFFQRYNASAETPFLAYLADEGFALDNHYTCSNWTFAGISCTLTGMTNPDAGHLPKLSKEGRARWPASQKFLAEYLADEGYYSVLGSSNSWLGAEWDNDQGYDVSFQGPGNAWSLYQKAVRRLESGRRSDQNFFMHIHIIEPHVPYEPPDDYLKDLVGLPEIDYDLTDKDEHYTTVREVFPDLTDSEQSVLEQHLKVRYRGELLSVDDRISLIFQDLKSRGLLKDALIVFWTDHGEQFWEHGHQSHAYTLHAEENNGIAFFWAPNIISGQTDALTSSIDLAPTILSLVLGEKPPSMTGMVLSEAPADRAVYASSVARLGPRQMVKKGAWKLIFTWSGSIQLYDTSVDPGENNNVYRDDHEKAIELWPLIEAQIKLAEPMINTNVRWPSSLIDNVNAAR